MSQPGLASYRNTILSSFVPDHNHIRRIATHRLFDLVGILFVAVAKDNMHSKTEDQSILSDLIGVRKQYNDFLVELLEEFGFHEIVRRSRTDPVLA